MSEATATRPSEGVLRDDRSPVVRGINTSLKHALFRLGTVQPQKVSFTIRKVADAVELGAWAQRHVLIPERFLPNREAVFDLALRSIAEETVLYLEFGVYRGDSLRYMARGLRNPESRLVGFDSFEGLPVEWNYQHPAGAFDVAGQPPKINDPRVSFVKGWFNETLPSFVAPSHDRLFVTFDADLYSSTHTALMGIQPLVKIGSYLYFDQFNDTQNELRAFEEFRHHSGRQFQAVGASRTLRNWLFLCLG